MTGQPGRAVPAVVVAGGLRWTAAEDGQSSPIGFELACRRGIPVPARHPVESDLITLARAATR